MSTVSQAVTILCLSHCTRCRLYAVSPSLHSTAHHSTSHHITAHHTTSQHSTSQHSTAQHSTPQHTTAQHSTAQPSPAQHSTAQHSTAQHRGTWSRTALHYGYSTRHAHTHMRDGMVAHSRELQIRRYSGFSSLISCVNSCIRCKGGIRGVSMADIAYAATAVYMPTTGVLGMSNHEPTTE